MRLIPACILLFAACTSPTKAGRTGTIPSPDVASRSDPNATSSTTATVSVPATPPVQITNFGVGRFEISATGGAPVRIRTPGTMERQNPDGTWVSVGERFDVGTGYKLLDKCPERTAPLPACVDVTTLVPVRWTGFNCSAQCNGTCRANSFEGPGTFRLSVTSCDGATTVVGKPFDMPDNRNGNDTSVDRWGLGVGATWATVVRLDVPSRAGFDASVAASPSRVAGFSVRAGSEHPIDKATLDELVGLLQARDGFDDQIVKRCAVHDLVGVRLTRALASTGAARTDAVEIALDFACNKFFGAFGTTPRETTASHFDAAHAKFLV